MFSSLELTCTCRTVNRKLGTNLDPVYVKVPIPVCATRVLADVTKAKRLLHWEPNVTVEQCVDKVIENGRRELRTTALSKAQKYALHIKPKEV
jgi:nucleoside-diphosphate-sugar epimerase